MSGAHVKWTPEMRARHAEMMRKRWQNPEYRARTAAYLAAASRTSEARARSGARMLKLHERIKTDAALHTAWRVGLWRHARSKEGQERRSKQMKILMRRPDMLENARQLGKKTAHKFINGAHFVARFGRIPDGCEAMYRDLIRKRIPVKQVIAMLYEHARVRASR